MTYLLYAAAALAEIAGCFSVWAWWRLERSPLWLAPGFVSLLAVRLASGAGRHQRRRAAPMPLMAASTSPPRWPGCGWSKACGPTAGILPAPRSASPAPRSSCSHREEPKRGTARPASTGCRPPAGKSAAAGAEAGGEDPFRPLPRRTARRPPAHGAGHGGQGLSGDAAAGDLCRRARQPRRAERGPAGFPAENPARCRRRPWHGALGHQRSLARSRTGRAAGSKCRGAQGRRDACRRRHRRPDRLAGRRRHHRPCRPSSRPTSSPAPMCWTRSRRHRCRNWSTGSGS